MTSIWYYSFLAWLTYGALFGMIGMGIARLIWDEDQRHAREIERENERLRLERNDLERKLKTGRDL
jgi:cell division protein FtsB